MLIGFCGLLLGLFGPSFGVAVAISVAFVLLLIISFHYVYKLTSRSFLKGSYRLLSIALIFFSVILIYVWIRISSEFNAQEGDKVSMDYAIVLGAGLRGTRPSETLRNRLDTVLSYAKDHPYVPIILSGGQGSDEKIAEAEAMAIYLTERGITWDRLILETQSTTTQENMVFSKRLMNKIPGASLNVLIITSDYHLFRAKQLAKESGYNIYGQASSSRLYLKVNYTIRECFVVIKTYFQSIFQ